jgi:tetratricopeptide (TPR) repeat protein
VAAKQLGRAFQDFDAAIALNPKFGAAYANRAPIHNMAQQPDRAIVDANQGLQINDRDATALVACGNARAQKCDNDAGLGDYVAAVRLQPHRGTPQPGVHAVAPHRH